MRTRTSRSYIKHHFLILLWIVAGIKAHAVSATWQGDINGVWTNAGNWTGCSVPNGGGACATLDHTACTYTIDASGACAFTFQNMTIDAPTAYTISCGTLSFGTGCAGIAMDDLNGAFSGTHTINSNLMRCAGGPGTIFRNDATCGTLLLNGNFCMGGRNLVLCGTGTIDIQGAMTPGGPASVAKCGTGLAILAGANTYNCNTNINAGTLEVGHLDGLGDSGGFTCTIVASGATLATNVAGLINNENLTIGGAGIGCVGVIDHLGCLCTEISGQVTLSADSTIDVSNACGHLNLSGFICGGFGITKTGNGVLVLGGSNTYSGVNNINDGTVELTSYCGLGNSGVSTTNVACGATLLINGGGGFFGCENVTLSGAGDLCQGALSHLNSVTTTMSGAIILTGNSTIEVACGGTLTHSGCISECGGARILTKTGAGTLSLSGSNTYTGATHILEGTVSIGCDGALGTAPGGATAAHLVLNNGGTLQTTALATLSANRGICVQSGGGSIEVGAGPALSYDGIIAGTGTFAKSGTGTLNLGGATANTHTGDVVVNSGTLVLQKCIGTNAISGSGVIVEACGTLHMSMSNQIIDTATLQIDLCGTLAMQNQVETVDQFTGGGMVTGFACSALTVGANNGSSTWFGQMSHSGTFNKTGTGTQTMVSSNTYTGVTTVAGGVLNVQHNSGLGGTASGTVVNSGAALELESGITVGAETLSLNGTGVGCAGALRSVNGVNAYGGAVTLAGATRINADAGGLTLTGAINKCFNLTVGGAGDTTIGGIIGGVGDITKDGSGILYLCNANTYAGITTISSGTIVANSSTALGNVGVGDRTNILSGATLELSGGNFGETFHMAGTGVNCAGAIHAVSGAVTLSACCNTLTASTLIKSCAAATLSITGCVNMGGFNLTIDNDSCATVTGFLSNGSLTKEGDGALQLNATHCYTGQTSLKGGLTYLSGAGERISNCSALSMEGGAIFCLDTFNETVGNFTLDGDAVFDMGAGLSTFNLGTMTDNAGELEVWDWTGSVNSAGGCDQVVFSGGFCTNTTIVSFYSDNGNNLLGLGQFIGCELVPFSNGILHWDMNCAAAGAGGPSPNGTWNGGNTNWNQASCGCGGPGAWVNNKVAVFSAGACATGAYNVTVCGTRTPFQMRFEDGGTVTLSCGTVDYTTNTARIDVTAGTTAIIQSDISGSSGLKKTGTGILQLGNAAKSYTGDTEICAGTLRLGTSSVISDTSAVIVNTSAQFDLNGFNDTIGSIEGNGSIQLNAGSALTVGQNNSCTEFSGVISGTGSLTKMGTGKQILSGANTYCGLTTVNAGVLNVQNSTGLGGVAAGATVATGAAIEYEGGITVAAGENLTLNGMGVSCGGALRSVSGANSHAGSVTLASNSRINTDANSLLISGNVILGANSLTFGGAGATTTVSGVISGTGGLSKDGAGALVIGGINTYTGDTNINNGTVSIGAGGELYNGLGAAADITIGSTGHLELDTNNAINNVNANIILNGGAVDFSSVVLTRAVTVGTLDLQADSYIDMGTGGAGGTPLDFNFQDSSGVAWNSSATLNIFNWTDNDANNQNGTTIDQIFFGSATTHLTASQLSQVRWYSDSGLTQIGAGAFLLGTGELVPMAVPETSTYVAVALMGALLGLYEWRRRKTIKRTKPE